MAENLLSILPDLQVAPEEVREAERMARQYLEPLFPTIDFRPGLATYDQVIRPMGVLLALANKGLQVYFSNNSLEGVTNDTPDEFVDRLMSNHFLPRREGVEAIVVARLYFLQRRTVTVSSSYFFSPDNERKFYPVDTRTFLATEMIESLDPSSPAPYYVELELRSEAPGDQYNIEEGGLLFFPVFDPFFVGGDIVYLKETSIPRETNVQYVARGETSVSTRNLVNTPSIKERMLSEFNFINKVESIGHDDPEMVRDRITVINPSSGAQSKVHVGGKVDVYVDAPIITSAPTLVVLLPGGPNQLLGFYVEGPVIDYQTVPAPAGVTPVLPPGGNSILPGVPEWSKSSPVMAFEGYDSSGRIIDSLQGMDVGFSSKQRAFVEIPSAVTVNGAAHTPVAGECFYVTTRRFLGVDSIQAYLSSPMTRVIVADYLARAMDVYLLNITIRSIGENPDLTVELVKPICEEYVSSIENGGSFVMSELVTLIRQSAGIRHLSIPFEVVFNRFSRNGVTESGVITDILDIDRLSRFELGEVSVGFIEPTLVGIALPVLDSGLEVE